MILSGEFFIGLGMMFVFEGLLLIASPSAMRKAMEVAMATPDPVLRMTGTGSAVAGLILIWVVHHISS